MSVSGISSTSFFDPQGIQNTMQKARQGFQLLGQDLQSGNLSAAQSDFTALQQFVPQSTATSSSPTSRSI